MHHNPNECALRLNAIASPSLCINFRESVDLIAKYRNDTGSLSKAIKLNTANTL